MSVKRTISFSDTTLVTLDSLVPKSKRSRFIDTVVTEALRKVAKEKALEALENCEKMGDCGDDVVATLRKVRGDETDRLSG